MIVKAMLVDDEWPILQNLKAVLPWSDMEVEVVALARNGREALERYREHMPDLVLCDIRMPVMDGMAFLSELRKEEAECDILMLTGYQEFEYAREALQRGVRDYILKPINYEQLEQSVRHVCQLIRSRKQDRMQETERLDKMAIMAKERLLYHALLGFHAKAEREFATELGMDLTRMRFSLCLADIDQYARLSLSWSDAERKSRNDEVAVKLRELSRMDEGRLTVIQLREGEWCLIAKGKLLSGEEKMSWDEQRLECLQSGIQEQMGLALSFVVHPHSLRIEEMEAGYKKLQRMLLQSAGSGGLLEKDGGLRQSGDVSIWRAVDVIVSGMRKLDQQVMSRALLELKRYVLLEKGGDVYCTEKVLHYLLLHLLRELREMNLITSQEEEQTWRKLQHSVSVKNIMEMIIELVDHAMDKAFSKKTSEMLMIAAKDYIHRRLSCDLGVEELANHLGISVSYFSLLFKTHFSETFVEYVTRQRMEMAQSLLLTTDKTVTEIGSVSGYSERRYFTKVFQKFSGMTPTEYREQHLLGR